MLHEIVNLKCFYIFALLSVTVLVFVCSKSTFSQLLCKINKKQWSQITICLCQVAVIFPSVLDRNVVIADACEKEIFHDSFKITCCQLAIKTELILPIAFRSQRRGQISTEKKNQQH